MRFRRYPWSPAAAPQNFRGALDGSWLNASQPEFLSRYKAVLCLENSSSSNYFTEKFVNAALAGSVPIYHANENVRTNFLVGAAWIDPSNFGFDPKTTLDAALDSDWRKFRSANLEWLKSDAAKSGEGNAIWNQVIERLIVLIKSDA